MGKLTQARQSVGKRCAAYSKLKAVKAVFSKYDKDTDGMLSRNEILAYAKGEFEYDVPEKSLDEIMSHNADIDRPGVPFTKFFWVRMAVGAAREVERCQIRQKEKLERQERLDGVKAQLEEEAKGIASRVDGAEQEVVAVEKSVQELKTAAKGDSGEDVIKMVNLTDELVDVAKAAVANVRKETASLGAELDAGYKQDLKAFLTAESKKHEIKLGRMESRIGRLEGLIKQVRDDISKKKSSDIDRLWTAAVKVIRYNQMLKRKLTSEEMFDELDTKADGELDEEEFLAFFEDAEKTVKDVPLESPEVPAGGNGDVDMEREEGADEEKEEGADEKKEEAADETMEEAAEEKEEAAEEKKEEAAEEKKEEAADEKEEPAKAEEAPAKAAEPPAPKGPVDERKSCMAIRRVIQKLRVATPANFDALQKELQDVMDKELENTGDQREKLEAEREKGLSLAKKRVEQKRKDQPTTPAAEEPAADVGTKEKEKKEATFSNIDPEKRACMAIRRVIQKLRVATVSTFDGLAKELREVLDAELENTGAQKEKLQAESDKGLQLVRKRLEQPPKKEVAKAAAPAAKPGAVAVATIPKAAAVAATVREAAAIAAVKPVEELVKISADEVRKLFTQLCGGEGSTLSKEAFVRFLRCYMRVMKEAVLADDSASHSCQPVRKLAAKEVVEVLQGPMMEEASGQRRLEARALQDGARGWVTTSDRKGAVFLKEGGRTFKVLKETILADDFAVDAATTRKLKVGELLEVLEPPEKEETTGVMRMKVKAVFDGATGFATSRSNAGTAFIDLA